jgi:hypothetical protein
METVKIKVEGFNFDEVTSELVKLATDESIDIQVKPSSIGYSGLALDPAMIIASGASVLSALITSLLAYLATRNTGAITITGVDGWKVEIPKGTPQKDIEHYVELARKHGAEQILIAHT